MKIIDPHVHLFDLALGQYQWLRASNPPEWPDKGLICRDFSQSDLALGRADELAGFIHIEAGFDNHQPWREIAWLEDNVQLPFRAIGGVQLSDDPVRFTQGIEKLARFTSVVGVRDILEDSALAVLSSANARINLQHLANAQLIFETQLNPLDSAAIKQLVLLANEIEHLTIIINHANFPPMDSPAFELWQGNINRLAQCERIIIKASGWEMVSREYDAQYVARVVNILVTQFGLTRVMLASNFPLCLFSQQYASLWQMYQAMGLDEGVLQHLVHDNAKRVYRLNDKPA